MRGAARGGGDPHLFTRARVRDDRVEVVAPMAASSPDPFQTQSTSDSEGEGGREGGTDNTTRRVDRPRRSLQATQRDAFSYEEVAKRPQLLPKGGGTTGGRSGQEWPTTGGSRQRREGDGEETETETESDNDDEQDDDGGKGETPVARRTRSALGRAPKTVRRLTQSSEDTERHRVAMERRRASAYAGRAAGPSAEGGRTVSEAKETGQAQGESSDTESDSEEENDSDGDYEGETRRGAGRGATTEFDKTQVNCVGCNKRITVKHMLDHHWFSSCCDGVTLSEVEDALGVEMRACHWCGRPCKKGGVAQHERYCAKRIEDVEGRIEEAEREHPEGTMNGSPPASEIERHENDRGAAHDEIVLFMRMMASEQQLRVKEDKIKVRRIKKMALALMCELGRDLKKARSVEQKVRQVRALVTLMALPAMARRADQTGTKTEMQKAFQQAMDGKEKIEEYGLGSVVFAGILRPMMEVWKESKELAVEEGTFTLNAPVKPGTADKAMERGETGDSMQIARQATNGKDPVEIQRRDAKRLFARKMPLRGDGRELPKTKEWPAPPAGQENTNWVEEYRRRGATEEVSDDLRRLRRTFTDVDIKLTTEGMRRAIGRLKKQSKAGSTAWGFEMLQHMLKKDKDDEKLGIVRDFFHAHLRRQWTEEAREIANTSRGIYLSKDDPDDKKAIRIIVIKCALFRAEEACVRDEVQAQVGAIVGKQQLAVGQKDVMNAAKFLSLAIQEGAHEVDEDGKLTQEALELAEVTQVAVDAKNGYAMAPLKEAFREIKAGVPQLASACLVMNTARLVIDTQGMVLGETDAICAGDPMAPIWYAMAMRRALKEVASEIERELQKKGLRLPPLFAWLDDAHFFATADKVGSMYGLLKKRFAEDGVELEDRKTQVHVFAKEGTAQAEKVRGEVEELGFQVGSGAMKMLGSPLGTKEQRTTWYKGRSAEILAQDVPAYDFYDSRMNRAVAMRVCGFSRTMGFKREVPPKEGFWLDEHDQKMQLAYQEGVLDLRDGELNDEEQQLLTYRLQLPTQYGGIGLVKAGLLERAVMFHGGANSAIRTAGSKWGEGAQGVIKKWLGGIKVWDVEKKDGIGYDVEYDPRDGDWKKAPPSKAYEAKAVPCVEERKEDRERDRLRKIGDQQRELGHERMLLCAYEMMKDEKQTQHMSTIVSCASKSRRSGAIFHDYGGNRPLEIPNKPYTAYVRKYLGLCTGKLGGTCKCHGCTSQLEYDQLHGVACGAEGFATLSTKRSTAVEEALEESLRRDIGLRTKMQVNYKGSTNVADVYTVDEQGRETYIDCAIVAQSTPAKIRSKRTHERAGAAADERAADKNSTYRAAAYPRETPDAMRAQAYDWDAPDFAACVFETDGRPAKKTQEWLDEVYAKNKPALGRLYQKLNYILAKWAGEMLVEARERWGPQGAAQE